MHPPPSVAVGLEDIGKDVLSDALHLLISLLRQVSILLSNRRSILSLIERQSSHGKKKQFRITRTGRSAIPDA